MNDDDSFDSEVDDVGGAQGRSLKSLHVMSNAVIDCYFFPPDPLSTIMVKRGDDRKASRDTHNSSNLGIHIMNVNGTNTGMR